MALTTTQLQTLKAAIAGDPTLSAQPNTPDGNQAVADALNLTASPDFFVWASDASCKTIFDNVNWANYTPNDAITSGNAAQWSAWAIASQNKQINLQLMLQGRDTFDATRANLRAGLNDATNNLPTGAGGALRSGGWATIQPILSRRANRAEKALASGGNGTVAAPATMGYEGSVNRDDVQAARTS